MSTAIVEITEDNFETEVTGARNPVLVDFWAPWCGPCRTMTPILEDFAHEQREALTVGKLNVDDNQGLAARYNVLSIPTLLLFREGTVVKKLIGALPKTRLVEEIVPFLKGGGHV